LRRLSKLALERRRKGLVELLPPAAETLRGTLRERYVTCGKPAASGLVASGMVRSGI